MAMQKRFDICTFGSITIDFFIQSPAIEDVDITNTSGKQAFFLIPAGAKISLPEVFKTVGGGAANSAVGLSQLGFTSAIHGTVGKDASAQFIRAALKKHQVNTDHLASCDQESGTSFILTSPKGRRTVFHHRSHGESVNKPSLLSAPVSRSIYISHLHETAQQMLFDLPQWKAQQGGLCVWTPGKTQFRSGFEYFKTIFPHIDYLILNREEAEAFTQIPSKEMAFDKASSRERGEKISVNFPEHEIKTIGDVRALAKKCLNAGVQKVIITDGRNGAQFFSENQHLFVPTLAKPPFCTLGAGDAFSVGVMGAWLSGKTIETQLRWGHANAASVVNVFGAQEGLLSRKEIEN